MKKGNPTVKTRKIAPGEIRVVVRYQLYVETADTGLVIAGPRLLKGGVVPSINFASDNPEDAEKQRGCLEHYLNNQK